MIVITNGQSFDEIAELLTLDKAYGPAIAAQSNMAGEDISGKRFRLVVPDNWAKAEYAGKTVTLPEKSNFGLIAIIAGLAVGFMTLK